MNQRNLEILTTIYQLRILSREQVAKTFFPKDTDSSRGNTYCDKVLRDMIKEGLLQKKKTGGKTYYQTTTRGCSALKKYDISFLGTSCIPFDEFRPNSKILLKDKHISHQEHLNDFILSLIQKKSPLNWAYRDDMYVNKEFMGVFHPDGVLECEQDCFFLEMDMGTESVKQLRDKWLRYRKLLARGFMRNWNTVTVLFLQKSTRSIQRREAIIRTIQDTISDLTDRVHFDIRIGDEKDLFEWFYEEMLRKYITGERSDYEKPLLQSGYSISRANGLSTGRTNPAYYVRAKGEDGKIRTIHGIADEFLLDENFYQPQSVLFNVTLFEEMMQEVELQNHRKMRYVIVERTEGDSSEILKAEAKNRDGILFTTRKRLTEKEGSERFYKQIDGITYHYNEDYTKLITE